MMNALTLLHGGKVMNHSLRMLLLWLDRFEELLGHKLR
jgi:hypothetical protein